MHKLRSPVLSLERYRLLCTQDEVQRLKAKAAQVWSRLNPKIPTKVLLSTNLYFCMLMSKCFLLTDLRLELHREL
jgi:hypothetical protein